MSFFASMKLNFNSPFRTLLKHDEKEMGGRPAQVGEGPPETNRIFGLEMSTYLPPELNSTGCENRTSPQQMPFQQIVSLPVIAIELPKF